MSLDRASPDALPASPTFLFLFFFLSAIGSDASSIQLHTAPYSSIYLHLSFIFIETHITALQGPPLPSNYTSFPRQLRQPQHAMNGTPLLPSAFPQTPKTIPGTGRKKLFETPSRSQQRETRPVRTPLKSASKSPSKASRLPPSNANTDVPLIPTNVIDAPSQRLYVVAVYFALNAWRIYESLTASDDLDSTWLLLKWATIDGIFLVGLQALRIPWLEWAFPTTLTLFLLHAVGNVFLMFRIPVSFFFF